MNAVPSCIARERNQQAHGLPDHAYEQWLGGEIITAFLHIPSADLTEFWSYDAQVEQLRTTECNGLIWVYMGKEQESPPPLPNIEANLIPDSDIWCLQRECNWLQATQHIHRNGRPSATRSATIARCQGGAGGSSIGRRRCTRHEPLRDDAPVISCGRPPS